MLIDPNRQQSMGQGLLNFLGSPESMALAQGLLAGSAPSMTQPVTFGSALGQGFNAMQKRGDIERKAKLEQERFNEIKNLNRSKLGIEQAKLGIVMEKFKAEQDKIAQRNKALQELLNSSDIVPEDLSLRVGSLPLDEQQSTVDALTTPTQDPTEMSKSSRQKMRRLGNGIEVPESTAAKAEALIKLGYEKEGIKLLFDAESQLKPQGIAADYLSIKMAEDLYGSNDPYVQDMKEHARLERESKKSLMNQRDTVSSLRNWNSLTSVQKENQMAQGRSIVDDQAYLLKEYMKGRSNYDIAKDFGYSDEQASNLDKNFAPTSATISDIQSAQGALAEEAWVAPKITEAMKPYSRKIYGHSPEFLKDAFSTDPDTQNKVGKALAARALQPEIAGFRVRVAGGSNAHAALQEVVQKSLNELSILETQVSPEVYQIAQDTLSEWIQGMGEARLNAMKGTSKVSKKQTSESIASDDSDPLGLRKK